MFSPSFNTLAACAAAENSFIINVEAAVRCGAAEAETGANLAADDGFIAALATARAMCERTEDATAEGAVEDRIVPIVFVMLFRLLSCLYALRSEGK